MDDKEAIRTLTRCIIDLTKYVDKLEKENSCLEAKLEHLEKDYEEVVRTYGG